MISTLLLYKIFQFLLIMVIGYAIAKLKVIKSEDSEVLSKVALYLLMPCAIINAFDFAVSKDLVLGWVLAFAAAVMIHIAFLLLDRLYAKICSRDPNERAAIMYSNAGNLILPIVAFILGEEWVVYSTAYLSVQLLFLWTHGIRMFSRDTVFSIKKILLNVNIIAILAGVCIMILGLRLPPFLKDITASLGSMLGPVGMLIAGILAAKTDFKKSLKNRRLYYVIAIRLVLYPLISLMLVRILLMMPIENSNKILLISFLASATPSAATAMQFAQINGEGTDFAVAINVFSTILCAVTMPAMVALYSYMFL